MSPRWQVGVSQRPETSEEQQAEIEIVLVRSAAVVTPYRCRV